MNTRADIAQAERLSQVQRHAAARWLVVDEAEASPEDLKLCGRVRAAATDAHSFDRALANPDVGRLFQRGILKFQVPT